jgi:hypothetical protein
MTTTKSITYPGFEYKAGELSAYTFSVGIFIISLKNGKMTHFEPENAAMFEQWLQLHKVRDIRKDDGIPKNLK